MARLVRCALALLPLACAEASEAALYDLREADAPAVEGAPLIPYGDPIPALASEPVAVDDEETEEVFDASSWPEHRGAPRIIVGRWLGERADDDEEVDDSARCPFEVRSQGFPAISADGRTIVGVRRGTWSASDGEDEEMQVRWYDVDRDALVDSVVVFDGDAHQENWDDVAKRCRPMLRLAKRRAAEINARLGAEQWRTLVDVGIHARDEVPPWDREEGEDEAPPPAAERPVELVHVGKQAAFRIGGVEVLHRADVDWLGAESWPCQLSPLVYTVLGDRETATLAVFLDHQSGGCLCNPEMELHTLRVPPSLLDEAAARPQPQRVPDLVRYTAR